MGTEMKKEKNGKVGVLKFWTWNFRTMSAGIQAVLIGYIVFYCTDVLELNAALVATLLMASKIFDGVTDVLAGYLVDKTHTKLGKARPYEFAILGLWLATWAVFSVPISFSTVAKCVWVVVAYTMAQSVFNTLLNANNTAYMVRAFNNQQTYVKLSSIGGLVTVAGVAVFNVVFPTMMANAGTDAGKWSHMILMLAAPLAIIGILRFFFVPEKYDVDAGSASVNFKEVITLLKTNKYIYFVALISLVAQVISGFGVSVYYFTYIVKDLSLMGIMSLFTVVAMLTMIVYPALLKKISVKNLIQMGCVSYILAGIVLFIAQDNVLLLGIGNILMGIGTLPISMMAPLLIIECADYNEWCGRPRMEGTLGSINGFANKIGSAIGTFICGVLMAASGYVGSAGDITVLPDSALMMIRLLYSLIPAAFFALVLVCLKFYTLDKKIDGMRKENEERRQNAEIVKEA